MPENQIRIIDGAANPGRQCRSVSIFVRTLARREAIKHGAPRSRSHFQALKDRRGFVTEEPQIRNSESITEMTLADRWQPGSIKSQIKLRDHYLPVFQHRCLTSALPPYGLGKL